MWYFNVVILCSTLIMLSNSLPTVYKYNENKLLEPDLVPVSSTVIPLPVYQVSSSINVGYGVKDQKVKKPEGPITLVTVHSKKKPVDPIKKNKSDDVSSIKEIGK